ncbi:ARM repeat-containing protein [Corynespora cassiicola Philippines]|uniref:ARM repeat-containing protein n=1 Tax=Corynespora cassiicola Philippines TaxID=1448308 RepID=A0A2T2NR18_CORCC|nr:ARM repeat-containing protein [Corynespora cassiicola Philippines]
MSFNITSEGSPTPRKGPARFVMGEELKINTSPEVLGMAAVGPRTHPFTQYRPISTSLTSSWQGMKRPLGPSTHANQSMPTLQQNQLDGFKKHKLDEQDEPSVVDTLLQRLSEQSAPHEVYESSTSSNPITPATTDEFIRTPSTDMDTVLIDATELKKMRAELIEARNEVARMNQELHTNHVTKSTLDHLGQSSEADYNYVDDITEQTITQLQNKFNASTRSTYGWNNNTAQNFGPIQPQSRPTTSQPGYRQRNGFLNEPAHFPLDQSFRGPSLNPTTRPASAFDTTGYNQYAAYSNSIVERGMSPNTPSMYAQSGPIGPMPATRLSPEANEFNVAHAMGPSPWNNQVNPIAAAAQYTTPVTEPMNYRRLLDRNMSCNWKLIVDKIIANNDQQASIFLQQKLKVGTPDQKYEIVEAIISQAYSLMVNRFGNFLVQRCFEHGTAEQVIAIAGAIRGNTLNLSMDAFGCHVIQKAFDCVPEEYKATMVHELLRRIPETVIHRYACHVWQKLFELRWSDSPPQIMRYVNEALRGMWHEVALGETGSLVVQNIFENCLEEDKRPCINEVLASIDVISHGQFGNWCIQHICEHGAAADRNRAVDHILRFATEYSMDQYASKVIEKCLKIGGSEFLDRYLERVCEGRPDRPRMPLIDIAGDQFGNYLIQYILTNSSTHHRDLVASHIRKHMVSLRGSKYGSRVAMLCCNPALATRPGPPTGMQLPRYSSHVRAGGYGGYR